MIRTRKIVSTIDRHELGPWREEEYRLAHLADIAPEGAVGALVNAKMIGRGAPEWREIPPDLSSIVWIETEEAATTIAIASLIAQAAYALGAGFTASAIIGTIGVVGLYAGVGYGLFALVGGFGAGIPSIGDAGAAPSQTYGFGAINYQTANGRPIPVVYGKHLVGGVLLQGYRREGKDGNLEIHLLLGLSQGPVEAIGDADLGTTNLYTSAQSELEDTDAPGGLWINESILQDSGVFAELVTSLRLGTNSQTAMRYHEEIVNEYGFDYRLLKDTEFRHATLGPVDRVDIDILYPRGAYHGKVGTSGLKYVDDDWRADLEAYETDGSTLDASKELHFRDAIQNQFWRTFGIDDGDGLTLGKRVISITKTSNDGPRDERPYDNDESRLVSIKEIQYASLRYQNIATLAFKTQANEKLSGGPPRLAVMMKGRKLQTSDGSAWSGTETWSQNPAWVVADMLTNRTYGLGNHYTHDNLDPASFKDWADFCDESVDLWTGAGSTEARCKFDGVFDSQGPVWEQVQRVLATARATLVREGNIFRVVIEEDSTPTQLINEGNVSDCVMSYVNRNRAPNRVIVRFLNAEKNYEQDQAVAETEGLDESTDDIREQTIDLYGITRATQANRAAAYILRAQTYPIRTLSFRAPISIMQAQVGDIVYFTHETLRFGVAGAKLEDSSGGSAVLDREVTFEADTIYTYYEQALDHDATTDVPIMSQDFSYATETTTNMLSFGALHGDADSAGRLYSITRKFHADKFRIVRLGHVNNNFERTVEAVEHIPSVFTDDAPELDETITSISLSSVTSASSVSVTDETSDEDGVSNLEVSFTPGSGTRHIIYAEIGGESRRRIGEGGATSPIVGTIRAPFQAPITVYVQSVNSDGARDAPGSWPSATYNITREDDGQDLLDAPGDVTSLTLTPGAGNAATLSWGVPADGAVDGYEVRIGNWSGAKVLYSGTATSLAIVRNPAGAHYCVKAIRDGIYSPGLYYEDDFGDDHASYPSQSVLADTDLKNEGTRTNFASLTGWHRRSWSGPIVQVASDVECEYVSEYWDLTTAAATHVGLNVFLLAFYTEIRDDWFMSSHLSFSGETAKDYVDSDVYIEHSNDASTWTQVPWTPISDHIITARYFRVRVVGRSLPTENGDETRVALLMIERIRWALYRA